MNVAVENAVRAVTPDVPLPTPPSFAGVTEQARALAAARAGERDADPVKVAGHAMDRRGVPLLRLILAAAALAIILVDPAEPDRHVPFTYATLALYTVYSAVVCLASVRNRPLPRGMAHWIDVAWHTLLISLSSGTNSLFFFFYFFDILVGSFRCGRKEGLRVTAAAAVLVTAVGYLVSSPATFELNRFLLRPVCLVVLGYMIAYFGGLEHRLRRRLTLLRDMTVLRNPRFGVHETLLAALEKLRTIFDADACMLLIADASEREYWLYESRRHGNPTTANPVRCAADKARVLLAIPYSEAMLIDEGRGVATAMAGATRWLRGAVYVEDVVTRRTSQQMSDAARVVIAQFDAESVATVPIRYHAEAVGRLYMTAPHGAFDVSDLDFLTHAMDTTLRVTENVRLIDRLAAEAADNERRRIARGIHHTVIQPYIGLQLGLGAILERMQAGDRQVEPALGRLLDLIDDEVVRLRDYVTNLRGMPDPRAALMDAVRRFARQFQNATGIEVYVDGPPELTLSERVAGELFEMTSEALSNIRRHTSAHRAAVGVQRTSDAIRLTIENDAPPDGVPAFEPRSLREHALSLGGTLQIQREPGLTSVAITIPL